MRIRTQRGPYNQLLLGINSMTQSQRKLAWSWVIGGATLTIAIYIIEVKDSITALSQQFPVRLILHRKP